MRIREEKLKTRRDLNLRTELSCISATVGLGLVKVLVGLDTTSLKGVVGRGDGLQREHRRRAGAILTRDCVSRNKYVI
jgi:hypothetical protein